MPQRLRVKELTRMLDVGHPAELREGIPHRPPGELWEVGNVIRQIPIWALLVSQGVFVRAPRGPMRMPIEVKPTDGSDPRNVDVDAFGSTLFVGSSRNRVGENRRVMTPMAALGAVEMRGQQLRKGVREGNRSRSGATNPGSLGWFPGRRTRTPAISGQEHGFSS